MAITLRQRMTRFKKRHGGVVPAELKTRYKAWRAGDESAALEILAETETQEDKDADAADQLAFEEREALKTVQEDITFMVHGDKPATVEPPKPLKHAKPARAAHARPSQKDPQET